MTTKTLRTCAVTLVFLLAAPAALSSTLTYGSNNPVGPGQHVFWKYHGPWKDSFHDQWKFTLSGESKISLALQDIEWALCNFKLLDIDNLKAVFDFGQGREYLREGNWYHAMLGEGTYMFVVKGDVDGLLGGKYKGMLKVSAVPVPAALWLFLSAMAGLVVIRRRQQQPQAATAA